MIIDGKVVMSTENNRSETNMYTQIVNNDELLDLLSLYLDGEATPKESELIEFLIKTDPFAQESYQALSAVSLQIRSLPQLEPPVSLRSSIQMATTRRLSLSSKVRRFGRELLGTLTPAKAGLVNVTAGLCVLSLGILSVNLLSKPGTHIKSHANSQANPRQVAIALTPNIQQSIGEPLVTTPRITDAFHFSSHPVASKSMLSFKVSHQGKTSKNSLSAASAISHKTGHKASAPTMVQEASWHSYTPSPQTDEMNTPMLTNATLDVPVHSNSEQSTGITEDQTTASIVMAGKITGNSPTANQHLIQGSPQTVPQPKMLTTLHMKWKPATLAVISLSSSEIAERDRPVEVNVFATHF